MNLRHVSTLGALAFISALALMHHLPTRAIVALAAYAIAATLYAAAVLHLEKP